MSLYPALSRTPIRLCRYSVGNIQKKGGGTKYASLGSVRSPTPSLRDSSGAYIANNGGDLIPRPRPHLLNVVTLRSGDISVKSIARSTWPSMAHTIDLRSTKAIIRIGQAAQAALPSLNFFFSLQAVVFVASQGVPILIPLVDVCFRHCIVL